MKLAPINDIAALARRERGRAGHDECMWTPAQFDGTKLPIETCGNCRGSDVVH